MQRGRGPWRPTSATQRLRDIVAYGESILDTLDKLSREQLAHDPIRQKAIAYDFQCVSEAASKLLDMDPSLRTRRPSVPWADVRALANMTRHEYGRLDVDVLWKTATGANLRELMRVARDEFVRYERASKDRG